MHGQRLPAWVALGRHLRRTEIARDLVILAVIGGLASFAILFTSRVLFDDVVHELSLSYAARLDGDTAAVSDVRLTAYDDANVAPREASSSLTSMSRSVNVTVVTFPGDPAKVARLASGSLLAGEFCLEGIVLDEASADRLDVRVGDQVTLWWGGGTQTVPGPARVCGIANVWHPAGSTGERGYVVAAYSCLAHISGAIPAGTQSRVMSYWFDSQPAGSATRLETIRATVSRQVALSGVVWAVVALGGCLWSFALVRVWRVMRRALEGPWSVIQRLGGRPSLLPTFLGLLVWLMATLTSAVSAVVARSFVLGWTDLYVAARQIWLVSAVMIAVAVGLCAALGRRIAGHRDEYRGQGKRRHDRHARD